MSLEDELHDMRDRSKKIVDRIEHARTRWSRDSDLTTVAYELGAALVEAQQLVNGLGDLAQREFYERDDDG
jgi:hypothetical protein